jgi:tellurite resistance protein
MPAPSASTDRPEQLEVWLLGLLTVAWADGNFDADERLVIGDLMRDINPDLNLETSHSISIDLLTQAFANDPQLGEQFLRSAVMVAVADGTYSDKEDQMIQQFSNALGLDDEILQSLRSTLSGDMSASRSANLSANASSLTPPEPSLDALRPVRDWLDGFAVHDPRLARFLCKMIPSQCPFERDISLFGHKVVHIPPLCKLNPLYEQLVGLRFRSLCYLADECGEDVTPYC